MAQKFQQKSLLSFFGKKSDASSSDSGNSSNSKISQDKNKIETLSKKDESESKRMKTESETAASASSSSTTTSVVAPPAPTPPPASAATTKETLMQCKTVELEESPLQESASQSHNNASQSHNNSQAQDPSYSITLENDLEIRLVCQKDITCMDADGVVNSANPQMQHASGVSLALVRKDTSNTISQETSEYVKKNGKVKGGDVVVTSAGSLQYKNVLHAVTPLYDQKYGMAPLTEVVGKVFKIGDSKGLRSIAMPALGAGFAGYPIIQSAKSIATAAMALNPKFLKKVIVTVSKEAYGTFQSEFENAVNQSPVPPPSPPQNEVDVRDKTPVKKKASPTKTPTQTLLFASNSGRKDDGNGGDDANNSNSRQPELLAEHLTIGSQKLSVVKNDLTKENVDAIVNAANKKLQHYGGLARSISLSGGDDIQSECDKIVEENGGVDVGEVVASTAGNLSARHVFHTVGPIWGRQSDDESDKLLAACVVNCLQLAHKMHLFSVSFPSVSSGIFGFPKDRCAKIMVNTASKWCHQWMDSTVREIRFVNIDDESCQHFKNQFKKSFGNAFS